MYKKRKENKLMTIMKWQKYSVVVEVWATEDIKYHKNLHTEKVNHMLTKVDGLITQ